MRKVERFLPFLCVVLGGGCGQGDPVPPPTVEVSDSAGIRFVRVPPLHEFQVEEWGAKRVYRTDDVELFRVKAGLFLQDGALVLANGGTSELIFIGAGGGDIFRVGREGDGPGEFRRLMTLVPSPDGGVLAFDWRFSKFSADGSFEGIERLDAENRVVSLAPLARLEDGTTLAVLGEQRIFQSEGQRRDTVPLMAFRPGAAGPDTLGVWPGLERAFAALAAGQLLVPIGFARTAFHASNGRQTVIGSSDSLDLTVLSEDLIPVTRIVAPDGRRRPSDKAIDAWRDLMADAVPFDRPEVEVAWRESPVRDRYPGFEGLSIDPEGRIWVGEYSEFGQTERRWVVFSAEGLPVGQVRLPALAPGRLPGAVEILALGPNRIALLRKNRFEEESVEVWQLVSGAGSS